jgi:hypothetical protein
MGLFSRGPKRADSTTPTTAHTAAQPEAPAAPSAPPAPVAADARQPGLVTNTLVQAALANWARGKNAQSMSEVLRQCATGELLLDASGSTWQDPARGFQPGDTLQIRYQTDNAGKRLLLAFTSNERLALEHPHTEMRSLAQPAPAVLKQAFTDYEGIAIDAGSDSVFIAYADEIRRGLTEEPAVNEPLKTALLQQLPAEQLAALAADAPLLFIAVGETRNEVGEVTGAFVPTVAAPGGNQAFATAFTSPAEIWAWDSTLTVQPTGFANIVEVARRQGQPGIVINPVAAAGSALIPAAHFDAAS